MLAQPAQVGALVDGKYVLERVLGRGGMGLVFAARHIRLGQRVALKFPLSTISSRGDASERVLREARAAMRIQSEHVARVYDVGVHQAAGPYLVMEYLVGHDLAAVLAQTGPIAVASAVDYVLQACEALAEAHARRIIHRDLKPSNLFLSCYPDGAPLIKVIDFGLAKSSDDEITLTKSGAMLGSPLFMAPEQMRGSADVDEQTDIWAIGATLYALLCGVPPFPGKSPLDVYEKIKLGPPRLTSGCPNAGAALEQAVLGCLEVERAKRYPNVAELARALAAADPIHGRIRAERVRSILERSTAIEDHADPSAAPPPQLAVLASDVESARSPTVPPRDASWQDAESIRGVDATQTDISLSLPRHSPSRSTGKRLLLAGAVASLAAALAAALGHARGSTNAPAGLAVSPSVVVASPLRSELRVPLPAPPSASQTMTTPAPKRRRPSVPATSRASAATLDPLADPD